MQRKQFRDYEKCDCGVAISLASSAEYGLVYHAFVELLYSLHNSFMVGKFEDFFFFLSFSLSFLELPELEVVLEAMSPLGLGVDTIVLWLLFEDEACASMLLPALDEEERVVLPVAGRLPSFSRRCSSAACEACGGSSAPLQVRSCRCWNRCTARARYHRQVARWCNRW